MKPLVDHFAAEVIENFDGIFTSLRKRIRKWPVAALFKGKLHREVGKGRVELVDSVNKLIAELAASGGVQVKTHGVIR